MNIFKKPFAKILSTTMILALLLAMVPVTATASGFRDVPANHFAAEAIAWVSSPQQGSFMVGDASNNFNPSRVMDMFETSITMAMAAGFRYTSITPAQQALFDRAYNNHSTVLAEFSADPRWRRGANREIAYLLELGILTRQDLDGFMAQTGEGTQPAPLTKEAASAFILRLSNNHETDLAANITFNDDAELSSLYRRYAYIAWQMGLVGDYEGSFMPRRTITRAEFALLAHHFRIAPPGSPGAAANQPSTPVTIAPGAPSPSPAAAAASPFREIIRGHITLVDLEGYGHIYVNTGIVADGAAAASRHNFAPNPVVIVNDQPAGISALQVGMEIVAGLNDDMLIISMLARSHVQPVPTPLPSPTPGVPFVPQPSPVPPVIPGPVIPQPIVPAGFVIDAVIPEDDGLLSTITGVLEEIHIAEYVSHLIVRRGAVRFLYELPDEIYNIYNLRRGMELRLYLQGREVYGLSVISAPDDSDSSNQSDSFIAYIRALRHGHTMVVEEESGERHTLRIGSETINTSNNQALNFRTLRTNMRLYIVIDEGSVSSVTILP